MAAKQVLEMELTREKDTKRWVRYVEIQDEESVDGLVHRLYFTKTRIEKMGNPAKIHVRVEPGE